MNFIASCEVYIPEGFLAIWDVSTAHESFLYFDGQHWLQRFTWVPGNVNFLMLDGELSYALVEIYLSNQAQLFSNILRAVQVPFSVSESGVILLDNGTIISGTATKNSRGRILVSIPPGKYALVCEMKYRDDEEYLNSERYREENEVGLVDMWCCLTFIPQENALPAVFRDYNEFEGNIEPYQGPFLMEAEPA